MPWYSLRNGSGSGQNGLNRWKTAGTKARAVRLRGMPRLADRVQTVEVAVLPVAGLEQQSGRAGPGRRALSSRTSLRSRSCTGAAWAPSGRRSGRSRRDRLEASARGPDCSGRRGPRGCFAAPSSSPCVKNSVMTMAGRASPGESGPSADRTPSGRLLEIHAGFAGLLGSHRFDRARDGSRITMVRELRVTIRAQ